MVWLHQRCLQRVSWAFRHLPLWGECPRGKNQRDNTTPFKVQPLENRTQPHFDTNCAIQISRFHVPSENVSHICNNLIEDSLCQLPWPCCAPQHDCKGGLGLTKSQEIIVSGKQFPSPLLPRLTEKKNVPNSSCFIWGLSSSEHTCIFTVWGFYLTILSGF